MKHVLMAAVALAAVLPAALWAADTKSERATLVKGNNQFALELYARLRAQDGNVFFSPYSISSALAMTYAGARQQTAADMAKTLHFELNNTALHPAFAALIKEINGEGKDPKKRGYQLSTANALWAQQGYAFLPAYLALTKANYGAGVHEVDFAKATEAARQTINGWVEKETHDKIKGLLQPGVLDSDTRLVLTNAIYFKGDWTSPFKKDRTREDTFHLSSGKTSKTPLMNQTSGFGYLETEMFQALELPYAGKELSMVVLLPRKIDGLAGLETALTLDKLSSWLGSLRKQEVIVTLPKFKTTAEFKLKDTLSKMGMASAFSNGANFSGMSDKESLTIGEVVQKAFVDVNEEGTEAAAATGVLIKPTSVRIDPKPTPVFRADHPFVFVIRDTRSGSILFLGRLLNPQQ